MMDRSLVSHGMSTGRLFLWNTTFIPFLTHPVNSQQPLESVRTLYCLFFPIAFYQPTRMILKDRDGLDHPDSMVAPESSPIVRVCTISTLLSTQKSFRKSKCTKKCQPIFLQTVIFRETSFGVTIETNSDDSHAVKVTDSDTGVNYRYSSLSYMTVVA